MSMSAVASHRWRWLKFFHWSTLAQRSSTSALTDSRQLVVLNERPSTAKTPRRCKVRVSSRPSARLLAADDERVILDLHDAATELVADVKSGLGHEGRWV